MAAPASNLEAPIASAGALRWVNFFNGRLLTGEDLSRDQEAGRLARLRLGRAIGGGIAAGLEVERSALDGAASPTITVSAGVALNRLGQALELASRVDIGLTRAPRAGETGPQVAFDDCAGVGEGTYVAGAGLFVLAIGPSLTAEGLAPASGLGNELVACNTAAMVEGVSFRLVRLQLDASITSDEARLRNRVAYAFLGTAGERRRGLVTDPFGAAVEVHGLLDQLGDACLGPHEVPLAVIRLRAAGIDWIDGWAVRRRLGPAAASGRWPLLAGERWDREAEATALQFQAHVAELAQPGTVRARERFDHLPPAGLLRTDRFSAAGFFEGLTVRGPVVIEGHRAEAVLRGARAYPPVDLTLDPPELIWLYEVRENRLAASAGRATPYVLFAGGHVPYAGQPRFDLAHWDHASYAIRSAEENAP